MRYACMALVASALPLLVASPAAADSGCCGLCGLACWCPWRSSAETVSLNEVPTHTVARKTPAKSTSLATKMSNSTKRLASNTKDMLTPKKSSSRDTKVVQSSKTSREQKPGFFKSMFSPEPPPPPKTIKEWMSLKQVHP